MNEKVPHYSKGSTTTTVAKRGHQPTNNIVYTYTYTTHVHTRTGCGGGKADVH
jgi:hypothetical protein